MVTLTFIATLTSAACYSLPQLLPLLYLRKVNRIVLSCLKARAHYTRHRPHL